MEMPQLKLSAVALGLALVLTLGSCSKKKYHVPTSAMDPTIPAGTDVVVDRRAYRSADPVRWDIVTFEPPASVFPAGAPSTKQIWIMRVVGMPGESIDFRGAEILIGDQPLKLPPSLLKGVSYVGVEAMKMGLPSSKGKITLAANEYFVLGDNTMNSNDSRFWGALPRSHILGKFDRP